MHRRDSKPQFQQDGGRRTKPYIAWPLGSAVRKLQDLISCRYHIRRRTVSQSVLNIPKICECQIERNI